ncbi:hypothetical protein A7H1H_2149 [Aliarcobacter butzleri 7h1h]|uniref:hypothetical protein n=1 Tax=Aliarcobacter butzleri TaxID=28197 RepID=UPI000318A4A7|nr:hypothetical protein [Aliarcobacter butzleri]AGR78391.1 hypothetical protein A7H1H_2149 [Aliarcobacter butzleri 7h1h]
MALSQAILNKTKNCIPPIEQVSIKLLIDSFNLVKTDKLYNLDWDEEQFSSHIVSYMNNHFLTSAFHLHINIEEKLLDLNILPIGKNNPKYLPRIDISISSWIFKNNEKLQYFFEAKNLSENNWEKGTGKKVNAKYYLDRYILTGIENFRTKRYYNGSIIGYILEGNITNIVTKLNMKLLNNSNTIQNIENVNLLPSCEIYHSKHQTPDTDSIEIKHIFLKF